MDSKRILLQLMLTHFNPNLNLHVAADATSHIHTAGGKNKLSRLIYAIKFISVFFLFICSMNAIYISHNLKLKYILKQKQTFQKQNFNFEKETR